jgi:hypothetical protein
MKSVSPKIASPRFGPSYFAGYFGDLADTGDIRLTAITSAVVDSLCICLAVVVVVGT